MPFWSKSDSSKGKMDYKAKMEHKLLQAKQTPEPVFDLAECGLKEVPTGVYSWCKICLKEALLLQDNSLTSLNGGGNLKDLAQLRVLDLHNNEFRNLPKDIGSLVSLQILYLNNNSLRTLPQSFSSLKSLQTLNLSGNKFKDFPEVVCQLGRLRTLDVSNNSITQLPASLAHVRMLDTLVLDTNNMVHPRTDICSEGTESIMRLLCEESGIDYLSPGKAIAAANNDVCSTSQLNSDKNKQMEDYDEKLNDYWKQLENHKAQKRKELLAIERILQEQQLDQAMVIADMQSKRLKLLEDVSKGQNELEEELLKAQSKKDKARQDLISELVFVERESNNVIEELLKMAERAHNIDALMEAEKREREEFEELFLKKQEEENICQKEILNEMTRMLQNESTLQFHNLMRVEATRRLQEESDNTANMLETVLDKKSQEQHEIVKKLINEEQFQKDALMTLMSKKDAESIHIRDQLSLIHDELAKLTMLELKQRDLKIGFQQQALEHKREILTQLLVQLLEQQKLRREEMDRRLREMEEQRLTSQQDYWLIQYQRLMAHKPASVIEMEANMDPLVRAFLIKADVPEYTSLFARSMITYAHLCTMGREELKELGLFNPLVISAILTTLDEVRNAKSNQESSSPTTSLADENILPSTSTLPSSPLITAHTEVECVVCMENRSCMLFLNCGHVCCCEKCATDMRTCPLCRGEIVLRFQLRFVE